MCASLKKFKTDDLADQQPFCFLTTDTDTETDTDIKSIDLRSEGALRDSIRSIDRKRGFLIDARVRILNSIPSSSKESTSPGYAHGPFSPII